MNQKFEQRFLSYNDIWVLQELMYGGPRLLKISCQTSTATFFLHFHQKKSRKNQECTLAISKFKKSKYFTIFCSFSVDFHDSRSWIRGIGVSTLVDVYQHFLKLVDEFFPKNGYFLKFSRCIYQQHPQITFYCIFIKKFPKKNQKKS